MTLPSVEQLYDVIEHTWPPAAKWAQGPFTLRDGGGGGSRVSAATFNTNATHDELIAAEDAMRALGQQPLFMVKHGQDAFDAQLATAGYQRKDPCNLYAIDLASSPEQRPPHKTCFPVYPPLATQIKIWADGDINASSLAIMERAADAKTTILGRVGDRPAGSVYAAISNNIAMLHALEIDSGFRRNGLGRHLTQGVMQWAVSQSATHLALITTQANTGANALYASLGMQVVGHYHYRIKSKE